MKTSMRCLAICMTMFEFVSCSDAGPKDRTTAHGTPGASNATAKTCLQLSSPTSWQGGISSIFVSQCGACHPGSMPSDYTTYAGVSSNISAILMRIDAGTMPKAGPLAKADSDAIHAWVTTGMPEVDAAASGGGTSPGSATSPTTSSSCASNTPAPVVMPQPAPAPAPIPVPALEPTYAKGVQPIMAAYCVGCHSAAGGTSPYLDTLARVKANYANIMSQVDTGGMPLPSTPTSALPTDKINILADWGTSPNTPYGQFAP